MADPVTQLPTRQELFELLKTFKLVKAFENLFSNAEKIADVQSTADNAETIAAQALAAGAAAQATADAALASANAKISELTGDVTASGPGSAVATLATVNSNVGAFGSSTKSATVTVNAKGLVTAASEAAITPGGIGAMIGTGPAFVAYQSVLQAIPDATPTKITFDTVPYDSAGAFVSSRFTPAIAGLYQVNWNLSIAGAQNLLASLYFTGVRVKDSNTAPAAANTVSGSALVFLDVTDYLEVFGSHTNGASANTTPTQYQTSFSAFLARQ